MMSSRHARRQGRRPLGAFKAFMIAVVVIVATAAALALIWTVFQAGRTTPPTPTASATLSAAPIVPTVRLVIPEGFTAEQIFERASEATGIAIEDFEAAAVHPDLIGLPAEAGGSVEGWLGPYTYQIPETATAGDVLSELVTATVDSLDRLGVAPEDRLAVLTKASLIERETKLDVDRPMVARVIENRLAAGMPLQLDSTVHFIVGLNGSVFTTAEARASDSPYNTYVVTGLPPGPIAAPGLAAIDAALHPAEGSWLYFVTVNLDTGETLYATTYDEHLANVEVLRAWMQANE